MIVYNMRERGPLEYDKFVLNTFQYINMINYYIKEMNSTNFNNVVNDFNKIYNELIALSEEYYMKYKIMET